jgi:hypothetical protein
MFPSNSVTSCRRHLQVFVGQDADEDMISVPQVHAERLDVDDFHENATWLRGKLSTVAAPEKVCRLKRQMVRGVFRRGKSELRMPAGWVRPLIGLPDWAESGSGDFSPTSHNLVWTKVHTTRTIAPPTQLGER